MKREKKYDAKEFNNIKEIIYNSATEYNNKIAFTIKHQENKKAEYENVTYTRLLEDVNALGTSLYSKLKAKGKRIAIIGKNRYEWVVSHLANLLGGIVSVPLDKDLQYEELENSLIRSKVEIIIFDEKLTDKMEEIRKNQKTDLREFICMGKIDGFQSVAELIDEGKKELKNNKEYVDTKIDDNAMNILLFTSGTTSKSKAVMLSQRNIASNIYAMRCCEDIRSTDVNIAFLPFHHIFGSTCIIMMLASGVKTVFPDGLRYIKQNLNEYKVTLFVGVPVLTEAIYKTIMKEIEKQGKTKLINTAIKVSNFLLKLHIDIRRKLFKQVIDALGGELRFVISGGAPADPVIAKGFNDLGIKVVQGYGLTETSPVIAAEDDKFVKIGSIGKAFPSLQVKIQDENEEGIGELLVKGPTVMLGYYENEVATKETIDQEGWLHTGDLAKIDKDGFIFITGRKKYVIVLKNGKNVYPEELEILLNKIAGVSESFVYGKIEDDGDYKISAKIVYDKDIIKDVYGIKDKQEIRDKLWNEVKSINKTMPTYKYIKDIIVTDEELIKTTTRKIKRHEEMKKIK